MTNHEAAVYAIEQLKKAGANMAGGICSSGYTEEFNTEQGEFSLYRTLFNSSLALSVIKDGKYGQAAINKLQKDDIDEAVAACLAAAEAAQPDEHRGMAGKAENKSFEDGVLTPDKDKFYDRVKEFVGEAKELFPKVTISELHAKYNYSENLYINTNGVEFSSRNGFYNYSNMFSGKDGKKATSFNGYGAQFTGLDRKIMDIGLARRLLDETMRQFDTVSVDSKFVGPIVLSPTCLEDFLFSAFQSFITDGCLIDGTSIWKDKLGETVAHPSLTVRLAPHANEVVGGQRFTADGFESFDTDIIKDGVLKSFMLSLYAANKTGKPRAANSSMNLVVAPGGKALDDLISGIGRGLYVNRFSGGRPSSNGDFSGVAKNSFIIENGKIGSSVSETMISGNLEAIFKNIAAISSETICDGGSVLPWIAVDGVTVSGK